MHPLREAQTADTDVLVAIDLKDEDVTSTDMDTWTPEERDEHRRKIAAFVTDPDKAAWVAEDAQTGQVSGCILWRYRNRLHEAFPAWSLLPQLDAGLFPPDGAFCEIFQLWVAPAFRRRGIATALKQQAEAESLRRCVYAIYTHTEERNHHVIAMNYKLGYREVRRGPIWDAVIRVSLIKRLD